MKSESKIQSEIFIWFRNENLGTNNIIFSVPNEGSNVKEQMYKKSMGMLSGASDLICIYNGQLLFVECKDGKGKQSEKQIDFERKVKANGFEYVVVRSLEQFKWIISQL
jgi:hypothetical protein